MDDKTFEQELLEALMRPAQSDASFIGCCTIFEPIEDDYRPIDFSRIKRVDNEKDYGIL